VIDPERVRVLEGEWEAALADAGFAAREVRLYPFPGEKSGSENRAYYFTPGSASSATRTFLMSSPLPAVRPSPLGAPRLCGWRRRPSWASRGCRGRLRGYQQWL